MHAYDILEHAGAGAFGTVWRARRRSDGATVAIKRVKHIQDSVYSDNERLALQHLNHPHISQLLATWNNWREMSTFIVMPDGGEPLETWAKSPARGGEAEGRLITFIPNLMRQLLSAVSAVHEKQLIHSDIKPSNVLVDQNNHVTLIDFSAVAKVGSKLSMSYTTLWYRAPEHLLGYLVASPALDLWALGCVMLFLANQGKAAFPGGSDIELLFMIFQTLGTPSPATWPELVEYPYWQADIFPKFRCKPKLVPALDANGESLARILLALVPAEPGRVEPLLEHAFIREG